MQPYRLMLVDDEEYLRQGVIRRIDWDACGFTVVGEAENGQAGLELAERLQPDVILTDIKMPFMDGLTMSRRVLETQPGVKIIMLSGFDDFEYAQEAIALGSMDYILKPIDAAELTETLMRVRDPARCGDARKTQCRAPARTLCAQPAHPARAAAPPPAR